MKEFTRFRRDRLREAMKENGASLNDIARSFYVELGFIEMDFAYRCAKDLICENNYNISADKLFAICKAVNVSADYLLGLSDKMY